MGVEPVFNNLVAQSTPPEPTGKWTLPEAIEFCEKIYPIAKKHDYFPALTGGCLYGERRQRKDVDIVFYSKRQTKRPKRKKLLKALSKELGIIMTDEFNWLQKATWANKKIDFFFPETRKVADDEYVG